MGLSNEPSVGSACLVVLVLGVLGPAPTATGEAANRQCAASASQSGTANAAEAPGGCGEAGWDAEAVPLPKVPVALEPRIQEHPGLRLPLRKDPPASVAKVPMMPCPRCPPISIG